MALPTTTPSSWLRSMDFPSQILETGSDDYELYEEDGEFVLSIELPGFDPAEITATWDSGVLNIAAEHEDENRGQRRTYHRRFRFPKRVDEENIGAQYRNGILEVRLPVSQDAVTRGTPIPIEH